MIFIIDNQLPMRTVLRLACQPYPVREFSDTVSALLALDGELPALIILDCLIDGANGFVFLHELASYPDTAQIPVLLLSPLSLTDLDLSHYGIVQIFDKRTVTPALLQQAIHQILTPAHA